MMSTRNIVVDVSPGTRGCVRLYFAREYVRYPLGNDPQYFTVCECDDDRNDGLMMAGSVAEPEDRTTGERRGSGMPLIPVPIKGGGGKMSSKPSKWLFDITGGRHEHRFFCRWVYFHFVQ